MSQHTELRLELTKNLKWNGLLGVWLIKHHELIGLIERAADALQALERVTWQPIETAPKDGTQVMLTNGISVAHGNWLHAEPFIREIRDLEGRYIDQDESDGYDGWIDFIGGMMPEPTLWMPLPTPPESKE